MWLARNAPNIVRPSIEVTHVTRSSSHHDGEMAVDTHPATPPTEDDVNGHMAVDAPLKENVSIFAAGGLILPPPDIKCTSYHTSRT